MSEFSDTFLKDLGWALGLEKNCLHPSQSGRGHKHMDDKHNHNIELTYDPLIPQCVDDADDLSSDIDPQINLLPPTENLDEVTNTETEEMYQIINEYSSGSELSSQTSFDFFLESESEETDVIPYLESEAKSMIEEVPIESVHPKLERKGEIEKKFTDANVKNANALGGVKRSLRIQLRKEKRLQMENIESSVVVQDPLKLKTKAIMSSKKPKPKSKRKSEPKSIKSSKDGQNNMDVNVEDKIHEVFAGIKIRLIPQKRAPKKHIPEELKDDKYWAQRRKNTEMARKSREASKLNVKNFYTYIQHLQDEKRRKIMNLRKITHRNERLQLIEAFENHCKNEI